MRHAQVIFRGLSDIRTSLLGQANTLNEMGIVANDTGRQRANKEWHHEYVEEALKKAWELYCDPHVDDSIGKKALTCDGMGDCYQ